jgi:hypothetical protein
MTVPTAKTAAMAKAAESVLRFIDTSKKLA